MRRFLILATAVVGVLALSGNAAAQSTAYNQTDCTGYGPITVGTAEVGWHLKSTPANNHAGVCANNVAPTQGFDGGAAGVGVGEDPAASPVDDPEIVPGVLGPDAYVVVDGDDTGNTVNSRADGYVGLSNWETGAWGGCTGGGTGTNSGGCLNGIPVGGGSIPTPACGDDSGPSWNVPPETPNRDGCDVNL